MGGMRFRLVSGRAKARTGASRRMRVLVLSPHTDDAELGAGGSIIKFLEEGHDLRWVVFSTAEESLPKGMPPDTLRKEFTTNVKALGLDEDQAIVHQFRVRRLNESRQDVLEELVLIRDDFEPDLVLSPSRNDHHQDHQVVSSEAVRAFKTTASIICYELPWNHVTFDTQFFIGLERRHIERKMELLMNYRSQLAEGRNYFSEEFIYGLAKVRGIQCDADYAEAFEVVRWML